MARPNGSVAITGDPFPFDGGHRGNFIMAPAPSGRVSVPLSEGLSISRSGAGLSTCRFGGFAKYLIAALHVVPIIAVFFPESISAYGAGCILLVPS
jgi:hypothetical protein